MSAGRLRGGEWLALIGAVLLLVALFVLRWYATGRVGWWSYAPPADLRAGGLTGWQAIPTLRWFALVTAAVGIALALAQAVARGPGLPVTLDLLGMLVAGLTTVLVLIRLATTGAPLRFGAVLGLLAAGAVARGAFTALRAEQGWTPGPERPIEVVELAAGEPPA